MQRFSAREFAEFNGLLASIVERGLPLESATDLLIAQAQTPGVRSALAGVARDLKDGASLPDALAAHPGLFPAEYCSWVKTGLAAGRLAEVLRYSQNHHSVRARINRQFLQLAVYVTSGALFCGLVLGLISAFGRQYAEAADRLGVRANPITEAVRWAAQFWWTIPLLAGGGVLSALLFLRFRPRRISLGGIGSFLPVWGRLQKSRDLALFSTTLALRASAGAPMADALVSAASVLANPRARKRVERLRKRVADGESLSTALFYETFFPRTLAWAVSLGESRGDLPEVFETFGRIYATELERNFEILLQILTPLGILALGNLAFLAVMTVWLPIFSMMKSGW